MKNSALSKEKQAKRALTIFFAPDAYERFYRFLLDTVMKHAY